jgi:hypothetical protein
VVLSAAQIPSLIKRLAKTSTDTAGTASEVQGVEGHSDALFFLRESPRILFVQVAEAQTKEYQLYLVVLRQEF